MALRQKIEIEAHEYRDGRIVPVTLPVSAEYRLTLHLDGAPWCVFACSGSDIEELVLGNLRANGIINSIEDVLAVEIDEALMAVHVRTARHGSRQRANVGVETTASGLGQSLQSISAEHVTANTTLPAVKATAVIAAMAEFLEFSVLHRQTHGVHGAALYTPGGERLCFFDEIGRHNAIDKTLGFSLQKGLNLKEIMVLSTGRLANEIIIKLAAAGASAAVSRAAPTSRSVETARAFNMLMIGGVRTDRFFIYHGRESVLC